MRWAKACTAARPASSVPPAFAPAWRCSAFQAPLSDTTIIRIICWSWDGFSWPPWTSSRAAGDEQLGGGGPEVDDFRVVARRDHFAAVEIIEHPLDLGLTGLEAAVALDVLHLETLAHAAGGEPASRRASGRPSS